MIESTADYDARIHRMARANGSLQSIFDFCQSKAPHASERLILMEMILACHKNGFHFKIRALRRFVGGVFASFGCEKRGIMKEIRDYSFETISEQHPGWKVAKNTRFGVQYDAKTGGIFDSPASALHHNDQSSEVHS